MNLKIVEDPSLPTIVSSISFSPTISVDRCITSGKVAVRGEEGPM